MNYNEILKNLIAIDTSTPTMAAIEWVKEYLTQQDIPCEIIPNKEKETASLVATIGDKDQSGIIFSGHLDVVPVSAGWNTNPFELVEKEGYLYGRGTTDMKGGIAVALSLIPEMKKSGKTFHFAFTGDEETTCLCVQDILKIYSFSKARGCIVMEATKCELVVGHKTINAGNIDVYGRAAHSSQQKAGLNALTHAVYLHQEFYQLASKLLETDVLYETPTAVAEITMCQAGIADNIIPDKARMSYNIRCLNQRQQELFLDKLSQIVKNYTHQIDGLTTQVYSFCDIPGFNTSLDNPFIQEILNFSKFATPPKVSYATEGGYFGQMGIPVVIWGPGTILSAHQVNESVALSELEKYYNQLKNLILK